MRSLSTGTRRKVVIVGAGFAGLSAACHLAGRGHAVVVLERGDAPGGRAARLHQHGYTFDTGPTVLTMPELIRATIQAAGADPDDLLTMTPLDPAYRACFADGSTLRVRGNIDATHDEIKELCGPREAAGFVRFCTWARQLYELEMPHYIDRNYDHAWELLAPRTGLELLRLGALRTLHAKVASFFDDDRLRRLFSFQALYAGMSPFQARAVYAVISYMDTVAGVYTATGGIGSVATALATAAQKAGTDIRYGEGAERIERATGSNGRVTTVITSDGQRISADAVVVTVDRPNAYQLLPGLPDPHTRRLSYSPSALVWHVGVDGRPDQARGPVAHHNIHFGAAWRSAFNALLHDRSPMPDPSILVTVPTIGHPELAPPGGTTLYVLEPVPNLGSGRAIDWTTVRGALRERLVQRLHDWGYLNGRIVTEHLVDPTEWAAQGMAAGTPFSVAHTFFQSGPFRPPNVDRRVPGLVFAGSGTVPGVGIPMVLLSGKLAAERVEELS